MSKINVFICKIIKINITSRKIHSEKSLSRITFRTKNQKINLAFLVQITSAINSN